MNLTLAFSPCPNDCFIFDAIVNRRIDLEGIDFSVRLADVEALNKAAFAGDVDVTKLSFHAYAYCADEYVLLDAGSALGNNCGPLLISKRPLTVDDVASGRLRIAIPGRYTTANFLLGLAFPAATDKTELLFSDIEPALLAEQYDAGLIIHENRFTYEAKGLKKIIDLGEFWERETGAPIPLGGIVIRRALPEAVKEAVNRVLRRSVEYAFAHRSASLPFVREHAQEMSEEVMYKHIDLYVNDYSIDLGTDGRRAVELLFERAAAAGVIPPLDQPLFLSEPVDTGRLSASAEGFGGGAVASREGAKASTS
jgi:1,4-dihydroxy-6-naphthoate synthase